MAMGLCHGGQCATSFGVFGVGGAKLLAVMEMGGLEKYDDPDGYRAHFGEAAASVKARFMGDFWPELEPGFWIRPPFVAQLDLILCKA